MAYGFSHAMLDCLPLRLNGADLLADWSGALAWPAERTLVVADLHLEKGTSFASGGTLLPPYDTRATLDALEAAILRHDPRRVICLGDSFHDGDGPARLAELERRRLAALVASREWIWIAGNHDPAPPPSIGGTAVPGAFSLGPLTFRHAAGAISAPGEVSGHYHPKASLWVRGRRLSGRCFLADARRIVLPAFGAYAGGLDARDPALMELFPGGCDVHFIGRTRIATLPRDGLDLVS
ncbi:MAG: ligase-associated DNA damage response endonuclease PdeM [Acidobacteriota bacterium]